MPSSPAAGWIQTLSKPASRTIRPLATQLRATPPAMERFLAPVASRSQVARLRSKLSASSWTRQATSFQCCIDGLASQSRSCSGQNGLSNSTPHSGTSTSSLLVSSNVELVAEKSAHRFEPDLLQRFDSRAFELVIALGFAGERIDLVGELARFGDVRTVIADSVHHHHNPFIEGTGGEGAGGVRQMMRHRHNFVRLRKVERIGLRLFSLFVVHDLGNVLRHQT